MEKSLKPNSTEYKQAFNEESYDRLIVYVPKGQKDIIKAHAEDMGLSVNAFIKAAIAEKMERDSDGAV